MRYGIARSAGPQLAAFLAPPRDACWQSGGANQSELKRRMTSDESIFPKIASSRETRLSNWATLIENRVVASPLDEGSIYHSIDTMDYVSVLALTADHRVPLVKQFRPAVRRFTLEFPGGMRDGDEALETSAIRELAEEAGLAISSVQSLATLMPESGRLGSRIWTFFAREAMPIAGWCPEPGVERVLVSIEDLFAFALDGSFDHRILRCSAWQSSGNSYRDRRHDSSSPIHRSNTGQSFRSRAGL
jgi:ADP-ribose pyrophosphatase